MIRPRYARRVTWCVLFRGNINLWTHNLLVVLVRCCGPRKPSGVCLCGTSTTVAGATAQQLPPRHLCKHNMAGLNKKYFRYPPLRYFSCPLLPFCCCRRRLSSCRRRRRRRPFSSSSSCRHLLSLLFGESFFDFLESFSSSLTTFSSDTLSIASLAFTSSPPYPESKSNPTSFMSIAVVASSIS